MIDDIKTVVWKEVKEVVTNKQVLLFLLVFVPVFGVYWPWNLGHSFVEEPYLALALSLVPLLLVISILTDSFAGERERHTLETLLATRLSDHAILFGKILTAVAYSWGTTVLIIITGLITVNVTHGQGRILMFPPLTGMLAVLITLLLSILVTSAGVLVSLRASTVRQAETGFIVSTAAVVIIPTITYYLLPGNLKESVLNWLVSIGPDNVMVLLLFTLIALSTIVLSVAMSRFRRNKLILD